jgi:hypothetical protein
MVGTNDAPENPYQKIELAKESGAPALAILCLLEIA